MPDGTWPEVVERWTAAESWGLDRAWLPDRATNPWNERAAWLEAWTALAGLAASTSTLGCGVLVTPIAGRNPALLALQALTVDRISGGRVTVGLGSGGSTMEQTLYGEDEWSSTERSQRFTDYVGVVAAHLRDRVNDAGDRWYRSEGRLMADRTADGNPRLLVAPQGDRALAVAAAHADVWNSYGDRAGASIGAVQRANRHLDRICAEIGRDPRSLRRSILLGVAPDTNWSSADEFTRFVRQYADVGIEEFIFYNPPSGAPARRGTADATEVDPIVEQIATETVPRLRAELG